MKLLKLKLACCESSFREDKYSFLFFSFFKILVYFYSFPPLRSLDLSLDYTTPVALVFEPPPLRGITDQRFETTIHVGYGSFTRFEINVNGINKDSFLDNELS